MKDGTYESMKTDDYDDDYNDYGDDYDDGDNNFFLKLLI